MKDFESIVALGRGRDREGEERETGDRVREKAWKEGGRGVNMRERQTWK